MASNFSAGQFDDAFSPKRLRNWEVPKETFLRVTHRFNSFIANDKGHLLPNIPRSYSPWGHLTTMLRTEGNVQSNYHINAPIPDSKYAIPKFYKKPEPKLVDESVCQELSLPTLLTKEEIFAHLRQLQLPIIWVVGLPTKRILSSRRNFCRQLAHTLEFTYINLDEKIAEWLDQNLNDEENPESNICAPTNAKEVEVSVKEKSSKNFHHFSLKKNIQNDFPKRRIKPKSVIKIKVETTVIISSEQSNESILQDVHQDEKTTSTCNDKDNTEHKMYNTISTRGKESTYQMSIELSDFLSREKIVEMLAFAMLEVLESFPTAKGFVFEGFPYDRAEATIWEKTLYPSALALFFVEGPPLTGIRDSRQQKVNSKENLTRLQSKSVVSNNAGQEQKKLIPVIPKYVRRFLPYSIPEAERICTKYEHKLIRVINAEDVLFGGMNFLSCLVQKALSQYSNVLSGKTVINYDSGTESDKSYMSSRAATAENQKVEKIKKARLQMQNRICKKRTLTQLNYKKPKWAEEEPQCRKQKCSECHKPIRKMSSISINSSVKAKTPPLSYEYCLPTPSLFIVGDHQTEDGDISNSSSADASEDEYVDPTDTGERHNYTPLCWNAESNTEDIASNQEDSNQSITTTIENEESVCHSTKDDQTDEEIPVTPCSLGDYDSEVDDDSIHSTEMNGEIYLTDTSEFEVNEIVLTSDEEWESNDVSNPMASESGETSDTQMKAAARFYQDRGDASQRYPGESTQRESIPIGESGESRKFVHSTYPKPY